MFEENNSLYYNEPLKLNNQLIKNNCRIIFHDLINIENVSYLFTIEEEMENLIISYLDLTNSKFIIYI